MKRCALLEGHRSPCAAWEYLPDAAEPRNGKRCDVAVEIPEQIWQRVVTRGQIEREDSRRSIIARSRAAAALQGYRGRISLVRTATIGPPAYEMFELRIYPLGGA